MCWASSGIACACLVLDFIGYTIELPDLAGLKRLSPASATTMGVLPGMCPKLNRFCMVLPCAEGAHGISPEILRWGWKGGQG
jgi:hypothetical protein